MMANSKGRYLLSNVPGTDVIIHDTEHGKEECNVDAIKRKNRVRSDDLEELLTIPEARECKHCMAVRDDG